MSTEPQPDRPSYGLPAPEPEPAAAPGLTGETVAVRYDREVAEKTIRPARMLAIGTRAGAALTLLCLLWVAFGMTDGVLRWVLVAFGVLLGLNNMLLTPWLVLAGARRAANPPMLADGTVMTLSAHGLQLPPAESGTGAGSPDAAGAGLHPWADVKIEEVAPGRFASAHQVRVRVPGAERIYLRDALSLDAPAILAERDRLQG